jgi:hypothetical protein
MVARCAEVMREAEAKPVGEKYDFVAVQCVLPMLGKIECRNAIVSSLHSDPAGRVAAVAPTCALEYCPHLGEPRPALCSEPNPTFLAPSQLLVEAVELFARVRVYELGPTEAARWDELVGFPSVEAQSATAPPEPSGLTVRLSARAESLDVAIGQDAWSLPSHPSDRDFEGPATRVAQLVHAQHDPRDPVVIEVGPGIQYHHITGLLNALGKRRLRNIVMSSVPTP